MAQPVKVELKPYFQPEFITVWLGMAEAFERAAKEIREAGERLAKLYEKAEEEDDAEEAPGVNAGSALTDAPRATRTHGTQG